MVKIIVFKIDFRQTIRNFDFRSKKSLYLCRVKINVKKNIAIFASGGGSNAEEIMRHFKINDVARVSLIVSNNPKSGALYRAEKYNIPGYVHQPEELLNGKLENVLNAYKIDFIVLAGYLKKVPDAIIENFDKKLVNIHPALLPKFGGQGMYGMNVHKAVVVAEEKVSGITIHYVNAHYDEGGIIEQHVCPILPNDSAIDVQEKVLELEHRFYAPCIEKLIASLI